MQIFTTEEFELSFKSLYRPLCLYSLRLLGNLEDAEDVVQQVFADVWDKQNAKETIVNLKSYLYRAVYNRSLNRLSASSPVQPAEDYPDMEDLSEEERIRESERDARLWKMIDQLPPERKKIFLMAKRDGMKYQEIADELHLSIKTVENQIGKALKTLRETAVRIYYFILNLF